ncbi:short chain dehydrogenase/reductase family Oxidoreductase [Apiospora aurea]|uniref:Short chain dehydrogenase/reductase family Oxidoreductase n=1 Tax=Apiospora aurea TaxID=335848 RepID=A0ABR1QJR4_9PEZI
MLELLGYLFHDGYPAWLPDPWLLLTVIVVALVIYLIKTYSNGVSNPIEGKMHGKVVMITGGTSGIGAAVTRGLAERGAQIVLLTRLPPSDTFLADYIGELRKKTGNAMIYAEQVDLTDLYSVRKFATKWVDNAPPRRLDQIILCAATLTPPGCKRKESEQGIEETWMVNYVANFHLLGILSPALRAQPIDRDVRVIIPTCASYISSPFLGEELDEKKWTPGKAYARSKLALMVFGQSYQKHLDAYKRPDGVPMNARVTFVDPGLSRSPGFLRWVTRGTFWGLALFMATYPLHWLLIKDSERGAQAILYAAMEPSLGRGYGGKLIKECMEVDFARKDVKDEAVAKKLWESTDKLIEKTEAEMAAVRVLQKKQKEMEEEERQKAEKVEEIEALVGSIKKGQEAAKAKSRRRNKKAT